MPMKIYESDGWNGYRNLCHYYEEEEEEEESKELNLLWINVVNVQNPSLISGAN